MNKLLLFSFMAMALLSAGCGLVPLEHVSIDPHKHVYVRRAATLDEYKKIIPVLNVYGVEYGWDRSGTCLLIGRSHSYNLDVLAIHWRKSQDEDWVAGNSHPEEAKKGSQKGD
jgi:hypothetical protein